MSLVNASSVPKKFVVVADEPISFILYSAASHLLVLNWLDGRIGTDAPQDEKEKQLIREASKPIVSLQNFSKEELIKVYNDLICRKAVVHLQQVATHRHWLKCTHDFLRKCGVRFAVDMHEQVLIHDLSKFSPHEVLGYAIMFGPGTGFRKIENQTDKQEWEEALEHHYCSNKHHPEWWYPKENGVRQKVCILNQDEGRVYLEESITDMLAARGERDLRDDDVISVSKWMTIQDVYYRRYSDRDRDWAMSTAKEWMNTALKYLQNPESKRIRFNGKPIGP